MALARKRITVLIIIGVLLAIGAVIFAGVPYARHKFFGPTKSSVPDAKVGLDKADITIAAQDLTVPWGVAVLPESDLLVTERPGTLRRIGQDAQSHTIEGVAHVGEGGLLGLVLHPDFATNKYLYLYLTTQTGESLTNRIERYTYSGDKLMNRKLIFGNIPGERNHDGGRLAFGPDRLLYATVGDAGRPDEAQDTNSLAGKILRLTPDGKPAPGNPFGNAVYSYGHRNPQGLAWDNNGQLWSTEHGRSGPGTTGYDELNRIKAGANYGWPVVQGDETRTGMEPPVVHSGPDETWAPAGLAYAGGSLYFGGLRGETLYQARIDSFNKVQLTAHFREKYGRLRTTFAHNGILYLTTSNYDGRGEPYPGDDKVIKINMTGNK